MQEEISKGERVRAYRIEGEVNGSWATLAEGSAIGHKRIQPVESQTVSALRLLITKSAATPLIRSFAAFNTAEPATRAVVLPNAILSSWESASPALV
jgi:alpha-L-fucosidase